MPELTFLSKRLKKIRRDMQQSQLDFAANCGISMEELSLMERKKTDPKLSTLQKVAAYTDMTVSDLLDGNYEDLGV